MNKINGIKSVDLKIEAVGYGVVNWNGGCEVRGEDGKTRNNHAIPKLRGYTNMTGKVKEDTGYEYRKEAHDVDFEKNPLYISSNCIGHHLFKSESYDQAVVENDGSKIRQLLLSMTGLVRGYVIPNKTLHRTGTLTVTDFVDTLHNGNFEQFSAAGARDNTSIFSKITFGDTHYVGYATINIESLQFISLDDKFGNCAIAIKTGEGDQLATDMTTFLKNLDSELNPVVSYSDSFFRKGTIFPVDQKQHGLLLNDDALSILVDYIITMIKELSILQGGGYMTVTDVNVDYNDSNKLFRIKHDESNVSNYKHCDYAVYYGIAE